MSSSPGGSAIERAKQSVSMERVAAASPVEVGTTAAAAQVKAMVEARFVLAVKRPRNMEQVRQDLLKECSRPSFALEDEGGKGNSALYSRPVGGGRAIEGLGIRFAEVAIRCMGNIMAEALTIQEDETQRVKYCFVLDLETNDSWADTVTVSKTVERRDPRQGDNILSVRTNSTGQQVFTVAASEDALVTKEAALVSKRLRTLALRLIPGDLQDECINRIKEVRKARITEDPDAAIRRVIDGMAKQHVSVVMLEEYLGHAVHQMTAAEISNLQSLYAALRDGETTWAEIMSDVDEFRRRQPQTTRGPEGAKERASQPPPPPVQQQAPPPPVQQQQQPAPPPQAPAPPPQPEPPAPQPQPEPVQQQAGAPQWAQQPPQQAEPPVQQELPQQQYNPPPLVQQPPPPVQPVQPAADEPKGKLIKGVQFPFVMTQDATHPAWNDEQRQRAEAAMAQVNQKLGKSFKLESTVKSWFQVELNQMNSEAMEAVIQVLNNWQ